MIIKLFNKIGKAGTDLFNSAVYSLSEDAEQYDAILVRSANLHDVAFPETLKCIARCGAGVNNIPLDACAKKGIVVFNTPGANANAVKELVICGLFLASRGIVAGAKWVDGLKGKGSEVSPLVEKGKSRFAGPEIMGKTLGIVGLGAIGLLVARTAGRLGMNVIGYDPYLSKETAKTLEGTVQIVRDRKDLYEHADYISLHVPATEDTKGMINADSIGLMKPGVRILNFSRGELVVEEELIQALATGAAAAYVTDFASDALIGVPGVTALPHLGASTPESEDNCAVMAAKEVKNFLEKGNINNSVNYPDLTLEVQNGKRICLCTDAAVSGETILKDAGIPIRQIKSAVRGEVGYTLAEAKSVSEEEVSVIKEAPGVLSLRVI